jgi:diguanylate cyclase (GGDEF)-like protein
MSNSTFYTLKVFLIFPLIFVCLPIFLGSALSFCVQASAIPNINIAQQYENGEVDLSPEWAFYLGEWLPLEQIHSDEYDLQSTARRADLKGVMSDSVNDSSPVAQGYGTYLLEIEGLNQVFKRPAVHMRNVSDAWQAWWLEADGSSRYLGESGKISRNGANQEMLYKTTILDLPYDSIKGILVIYLSNHNFDRSGLFGRLRIVEKEQASRRILIDVASRFLLIGVSMFVVIQNLIFYQQRPKEKDLLLLTIFAFVVLLRGLIPTDYFYVFVGVPSWYHIIFKLEYILIIWPAVMGAHFFANFCPFRGSKLYIQMNYVVLLFTFISIGLLSSKQVISYLVLYQIILVIITLSILIIVGRGVIKKMPGSRALMFSLIPLIIGMGNDIYASHTSHYNVFIAEYALFSFLFMQSQVQASRYISALDTAEHLSNNLQEEINCKTKELSSRNSLLEEKAIDLEQQRNKIKELSKIDHLTGLFNRQTIDENSTELFKNAVETQSPLSFVMMDIDNFKSINDKHGHGVGDMCLKFVANYLTNSNLRKNDIIARYGGEEILILLANTNLADAEVMTQRLCEGLSQESIVGEHPPIILTASFGVAERGISAVDSAEKLINEADKALYLAKKKGKNRVEIAQP